MGSVGRRAFALKKQRSCAHTHSALLTGITVRASVASGPIQTSFLEIPDPSGGGTSVKFRCGILVLVGASSPVTPVGTWGGEVFCLLVVLTGLGFSQSNGVVPLLGCTYDLSACLFPLCLEVRSCLLG